MTGIPLMSARYYTTLSMQETLLLRTNQLRPCVPRKDSISHFQSVKSFMAYMSQSLNTFYYCTKYRKFGKEGCSSHTIEARTVHEVVLADIQKHAGQALTDRKAMVMEIAERFNLQLSADKEQLSSIEHFAKQVSGYAGIKKRNFEIINQLMEKFLFLNP